MTVKKSSVVFWLAVAVWIVGSLIEYATDSNMFFFGGLILFVLGLGFAIEAEKELSTGKI